VTKPATWCGIIVHDPHVAMYPSRQSSRILVKKRVRGSGTLKQGRGNVGQTAGPNAIDPKMSLRGPGVSRACLNERGR
jgi:hypothetical protein